MKERWRHAGELGRDRERDRFDPIVAGERHGLSRESSLAIWAAARLEVTDYFGRWDPAQAQQRFHELAARAAARAPRRPLEPGKQTAVGTTATASRRIRERPHAPGRETLVMAEARSWSHVDAQDHEDARAHEQPALAEAPTAAERPALAEAPTPAEQPALAEAPTAAEPSTRGEPRKRGERARPAAGPRHAPASISALFGSHRGRHASPRVVRAASSGPLDGGRVDATPMSGARTAAAAGTSHAQVEAPSPAAVWRAPRSAALPAVMRSAERAEIDPDAVELVARARRDGAPLHDALRADLEAALDARLDGVRVHTGPDADAAARALGARAFAIGDDVVFRDGAYDPHGRDGQQLIAHEVAHTVQARRSSLAGNAGRVSQPGDAPEREADAFAEAFVHRRHDAGARRDLSPASASHRLQAADDARAAPSVTAASATIYRQDAPAAPRGDRRSRAALVHPEVSPETARRYDAFLDGVYAAAQQIVAKNIANVEAWRSYVLNQLSPRQMNAQVFATGFEQLEHQATSNHAEHLLAPYAHEANPVRQSLYEHQMAGQWRACTGCHVSNQAWAADGRMRTAHDPGVTPAELLSGHAGTGFSSGRSSNLDIRIWSDPGAWASTFAPPGRPSSAPARPGGPERSLAAARQALAQIRPQLQPLGDGGYKIIPSNVISRFGQAPAEELRAAIQAAFARRLRGYGQLMARLRAHSIDYLELDTLVTLLKPMASRDVRALVDDDVRRREIRAAIVFVGMLLADLLAIVVPPFALVAGALHVAHGVDQAVVGTDRANATGLHDVMSPERQASGQMMQMAGTLEVLGGAVQVGLTASGLASAGGGVRVVATHTRGGITLEVLENGVVRGTHAAYPGKSLVMQPDGSVRALDELGNVVGTGRVGAGGSQAAAAEAWGTPGAGGGAAPPAGASAAGNAAAARSAGANPAAGAAPGAESSALAPVPRALSPLPEVSPFYTGGAGAGTFPNNQYNPCGRGDNCGFASMSRAHQIQNPGAPIRSAEDLYFERLQQLGIPVDDNLSRQLVFPEREYQGLRSRPGYEPLFDDNGGNRLSQYTLPSTARALGIQGIEANGVLARWHAAFGRHASTAGIKVVVA